MAPGLSAFAGAPASAVGATAAAHARPPLPAFAVVGAAPDAPASTVIVSVIGQ
jgi:hypothetical protein